MQRVTKGATDPPGVGKTCLKHLKKPLSNKQCSTLIVNLLFHISVLQCKESSYFKLSTDLQQYRDAVTLLYSNGGCILLIDSFHWLQVCYSGVSPHETFKIQEVIKQTIYSISLVLPYNDYDFHFGFQCQLCLESNTDIHPAHVNNTLSANGFHVSCTKDSRKTEEDNTDKTKCRRLPWIFNSGEFHCSLLLPSLCFRHLYYYTRKHYILYSHPNFLF